jgi:hypothetical protein
MDLFDLIKKMFSDKDWDSIGKYDKAKNFFMINRIMSINFPVQANQFNGLKINPPSVIDWWHGTLINLYTKPPYWIYTKTKKKETKKLESKKDYSEIELFIREKYQVSKRDLNELKKFYPEKYESWIKDISEQLGVKI